MKPTDKTALTDYLRNTGLQGSPTASKAQTKVNQVKGSPRYGLPYIEVQIGGRTVHRYAADGSQDIKADTQAFKPNTGRSKPKNLTNDAQTTKNAALKDYLKTYN